MSELFKSWSWICASPFGECDFSFLKTSQVQINSKLNEKNNLIAYQCYKDEKKCVEKVSGDLSWSHFSSFKETFVKVSAQNYRHHFIVFQQEIIEVREWIPHIGPLTKVIRLTSFLDIVLSSSEDIRELKHERFWDADGNRKRTFCVLGPYCLPDVYTSHPLWRK